MGGKKEEPSKKTQNKAKEKVITDLTFGLKNKNKSKVVQQYVKEVTNKVMFSQVKVNNCFLDFLTSPTRLIESLISFLGWR